MSVTTKTFSTLVTGMATAIQGACKYLLDFTVGSILRSTIEAVAGVVLWLQGLILSVLARTRAATSDDDDLDSWMADFGLTRTAAVAATGNVTFSRYSTTSQAVVPVGAGCETDDGDVAFAVTEDTTNAAYSSNLGGYVMAAGVSNVTVPVQCTTAGAAGNVVAGGITTITTSISGVDTVTNASAFTSGADKETDDDFRTRFRTYIASLEKATENAVKYAIISLQSGLSCKIIENKNYAGSDDPGYFYVVVDDGTGSPSQTLLDNAYAAVDDAVRGLTITFGVFAPTVVSATVTMSATIASGYNATSVKTLIKTAIQKYINGLGMGETLYYTRLAQIAYDASDGVANITGLTVNGSTLDITVTLLQVIKAGTVTVS